MMQNHPVLESKEMQRVVPTLEKILNRDLNRWIP